MKRHAPNVRDYMTHLPLEAERCETADDAVEAMRRHQIHHIPVMSGSHLTGILSQTELLQAQVQLGQQFAQTPIEEICSTDPLVVGPVEPIEQVAAKLLERKVDCAVVMDGGFVVGVFTATDVLRFICGYFGQPSES